MTPNQLPSNALRVVPQGASVPAPQASWGPPPLLPGGAGSGGEGDEKPVPWYRYINALKRSKWLIGGILFGGMALGIAATRMITPQYEAQATLWIANDERPGPEGPVGQGQLLSSTAWVELFRSRRVTQAVVSKRRLFLHADGSDGDMFRGFAIADNVISATYALAVSSDGRQFTLSTKEGYLVDHGVPGDSIGHRMGMLWQPPASTLRAGRKVRFSVTSLGQAANGLLARVSTQLPGEKNFLQITLVGLNPNETAATLNDWIAQFIAEAADLKKRKVADISATIGQQLSFAEKRLKTAENTLREFETNNIGAGSAVGAHTGSNAPADPALEGYFGLQVQHETIQRDIEATRRIVSGVQQGTESPEALLGVPSLMLGADNLRAAITEHNDKEKQLRELRRTFTEEYKGIKDVQRDLQLLDTQTIPKIANDALARLGATDNSTRAQLATSSQRLREVPTRTIEELRLRRDFESAQELYTSMQKRYEASRLAEATTVPDVQVLDAAEPPQQPNKNTASRLLMAAFFISLMFGVGLALLREQLDQRFRYPQQAGELGLPILGTVPRLPSARRRSATPEEAAQVIEAFRGIRQNLMQMYDPAAPMILTVTSPGPGEGKSLISSNLAMSLAETGRRTLLIDGDIRRGQLHSTFGLHQSPGLLDYLAGEVGLQDAIQESDYSQLSILTCGTRRHRGPELLASDAMVAFLALVIPQFDCIIIDSPPLAAGVDAYALSTVAANVAIVMRVGVSDRKVAQHKLAEMDRYPVRQLGAILNDFTAGGEYSHYSYLYGYTLDEGDATGVLPPSASRSSGAMATRDS